MQPFITERSISWQAGFGVGEPGSREHCEKVAALVVAYFSRAATCTGVLISTMRPGLAHAPGQPQADLGRPSGLSPVPASFLCLEIQAPPGFPVPVPHCYLLQWLLVFSHYEHCPQYCANHPTAHTSMGAFIFFFLDNAEASFCWF